MLTYRLLQDRYRQNGWDTNLLVPVYCDHGTGSGIDLDRLLGQLGEGLRIVTYTDKNHTERDMRQRRHREFVAIAREIGAAGLVLGHTATDRIETSILHMMRGCDVRGFVGMRMVDRHRLDSNLTVYRLLLEMTKDEVLARVQQMGIEFFVDPSNTDVEYSLRNRVRHEVLAPIMDSHLVASWLKVYAYLEQSLEDKKYTLEPIKLCPERSVSAGYKLLGEVTSDVLSGVLHELGAYRGVTSANLGELEKFLTTATSGHKYRNGITRFVAHGERYVFVGEDLFWEKVSTGVLQDERMVGHIGFEPGEMGLEPGVVLRYPQA